MTRKIPAHRSNIWIVARTENARPRSAKSKLVKQILLETESGTEVFIYHLLTRKKTTSYLVETNLKFLPVVNARFVEYLNKCMKGRPDPFTIDSLRNMVSNVCGVRYPREIIIAACYLSLQLDQRLNVSFDFGEDHIPLKPIQTSKPLERLPRKQPECQHMNIEKRFRTVSPGEVEPYKICLDCGKINP